MRVLLALLMIQLLGCGRLSGNTKGCNLLPRLVDRSDVDVDVQTAPSGMRYVYYQADLQAQCESFTLNRSGGFDLTIEAVVPDPNSYLAMMHVDQEKTLLFSEESAPMLTGSISVRREFTRYDTAFQLPWADQPENLTLLFVYPDESEPAQYPRSISVSLRQNDATF